jgi:peroxiredoxin Q/BCP
MIELKVGQKAPFFSGISQDEKHISISDYNNKLILFFYPKDNTPGCTLEACNLSANYTLLAQKGFDILGVSPDNISSHIKFINKHHLCFDLIADTEKIIANDYGVWGEKKFMGRKYFGIHRTTFVINQDQVIEKIFKKVDTKNHATQILESYQ